MYKVHYAALLAGGELFKLRVEGLLRPIFGRGRRGALHSRVQGLASPID
jgi:hypothetical protein